MSPAALCLDNLIKTGTMTAASSASGMPASNVASDQGSPDAAWQTPAGVVTAVGGAVLGCTFASAASTVRVVGIFRTNLTSAASITFTLINLPSTNVWSTTVAGPITGYGQVVVVMPNDVTADYLQVSIDDPTNPNGFINVPLAYCGPRINPGIGFSWDSVFGRDDQVQERTSHGGQEYPSLQYQRRQFHMRLAGVTEAEHWAWLDRLDRTVRSGGNILVIPDAASAYLNQAALFGRAVPTAGVSFPGGGNDLRAWAADVTERI